MELGSLQDVMLSEWRYINRPDVLERARLAREARRAQNPALHKAALWLGGMLIGIGTTLQASAAKA